MKRIDLARMGFGWLLATVLLGLAGCGEDLSVPKIGPFLIQVDPADRGRFDQIAASKLEDRKKAQITYLARNGHDLKWFPDSIGEIGAHDTVQIIYFNYRDYVVGFCSGAFLSDGFIASAAHCNSAVYGLGRVGAKCRENVLFAYKEAKDASVQYYACDEVAAYQWDESGYEANVNEQTGAGEKRYRGIDHVLFRLADLRPKAPLRRSASRGDEWLTHDGGTDTDDVLLALVVDPPTGGKNLSSQYDLAVGEVIDRYATAKANRLRGVDMVHFQALVNGLQSGNSGGPIYLLPGTATKGSEARRDEQKTWAEWDRIYTGPYHGQFPGNIYVYPDPYQSLPSFFREARP